ncbi:hypothetical protein L484_018735 [Morus notabilis]|uniref:Hikeshi-like C-terminal domain-containing protein n=1 Tax=Morus notabilis TaxID=981085 RepID=W9S5F7_9ROSA|nr:hypothetical protein L484_018735 [Morus notabilis]
MRKPCSSLRNRSTWIVRGFASTTSLPLLTKPSALIVYTQSPSSPFVLCVAIPPPSLPPLARSSHRHLLRAALDHCANFAPLSVKIGVLVEDLTSLPLLDVAAEKRIERLVMKVGENLFTFMQSFCNADGSKLEVPVDILDRWFKKFQEKAKREPDFLKDLLWVHSSVVEHLTADQEVTGSNPVGP